MSEQKLSGIEKVKQFMLLSGQHISKKPDLTYKTLFDFRANLINEELNELIVAFNEEDKVEMLDALVDLQYVLYGAVLTFGMQDVWKEAFENVHQSNMSKFCKTEEEAEATINMYLKRGISVYSEKVGELIVVYRTLDKKVMKSIDYIPASLSKFIDNDSITQSTKEVKN